MATTIPAGRTAEHALRELGDAAARVRRGWVPAGWTRVDGPGPDFLPMVHGFHLQPILKFEGIVMEPGRSLELELQLELPESIEGVALDGDALEMTIESLLPIEVRLDGRTLLDEEIPIAANGPAVIRVVPEIRRGPLGKLRLRFHPPQHATHELSPWWNQVRFSTPGLQRRFEELDLAHAQLLLASALAADEADRDALAAAAAHVPDDLRGVARELERFDARAKALRVHVVGHTHIDLNWLWTWPDTVEVVKRDFRSILAMLDDYPEMTFTHSQPATYEIIRREEPALFERVLEHIRSGRWECATLQWVEADSNIPSGESHVRQLQEAVAYSRQVLGAAPRLLLAPDTFGHAGNLPQIAAQGGAEIYYHHRANPGQRSGERWPAYWWEGQDGSRLLGVSTPVYGGFVTATALADAAIELGLNHGLGAAMYFHGVIDHGGGPTRLGLDVLRRLQDAAVMPTCRCGTVAGYAEEVLASGVELPVHRGESDTVWEGCYTTHGDIKRQNRLGENLLGTAETLAALAGLDRAEALREPWRKVLFNQFHDIIDGTAIHAVYDDARADFEAVRAGAAAVAAEALDVLQPEGGGVAVTNPLGFDRSDLVEVATDAAALRAPDGTVVPVQSGAFVATVPAFGTVCYEPVEAEQERPLTVRTLRAEWSEEAFFAVETPHFEARVRRDSGIITCLLDRRTGRQLVGPGAYRWFDPSDSLRSDLAFNVLQVLDEEPHPWAAWDLGKVRRETVVAGGATTTLREIGPVRAVLEVLQPIRSSVLRQEIHFYRDLARIDFRCRLEWNEPGGPEIGIPNLKVAFNPSFEFPSAAWYETPFGAASRPADGREVPALRWADTGGESYGIAVLNDCKYGYDALGARLRLTLVRTAYHPDASSDTGQHEFAYSLVPHLGDWRSAAIPEQALGFNQPLVGRARRSAAEPGWRPRLEGDAGLLISSFKAANARGGLALRLYDSRGAGGRTRLLGLPEGARAWAATILEEPGRELEVRDGAVELSFKPWQIQTVVIR